MYQIHLGKLGVSPDEFRGQLIENPARTVAKVPPAIVQTPPPTQQQQCQALLVAWKAANPTLAACLTQADEANLVEICAGGIGTSLQTQAATAIQNYVGAACAKRNPPTVVQQPTAPPFQVPTETQTPPITPPPAQNFPGGPPADQPAAPPTRDTTSQPQKSLLRQVGPIVGIGLLAAVGLTYARKRALTKKRRRK